MVFGTDIIQVGPLSEATIFEKYNLLVSLHTSVDFECLKQLFGNESYEQTTTANTEIKNNESKDSPTSQSQFINSLAVFQDSFMSSLLKKDCSTFSDFKPNMTNYLLNFSLDQEKNPLVKDRKSIDTFFLCSFKSFQSLIPGENRTADSHLLDDTLPVWNNSSKQSSKRKSLSILSSSASTLPKLRRCRSLNVDTNLQNNEYIGLNKQSPIAEDKTIDLSNTCKFTSIQSLENIPSNSQNKTIFQNSIKKEFMFRNVRLPLTSSTPKQSVKSRRLLPSDKKVLTKLNNSSDLFLDSMCFSKILDNNGSKNSSSINKEHNGSFDYSTDLFCN